MKKNRNKPEFAKYSFVSSVMISHPGLCQKRRTCNRANPRDGASGWASLTSGRQGKKKNKTNKNSTAKDQKNVFRFLYCAEEFYHMLGGRLKLKWNK